MKIYVKGGAFIIIESLQGLKEYTLDEFIYYMDASKPEFSNE